MNITSKKHDIAIINRISNKHDAVQKSEYYIKKLNVIKFKYILK